MGGSSKKGTSTTTSTPAPPEIAPEFQPYASAVGTGALRHLGEFNLSDFAGNMALQVPGLNDMQRSALDRINQRFDQGIPAPEAEKRAMDLFPYATDVSQTQIGLQPNENTALDIARFLPQYASQQIGSDPIRMFQYGQAQDAAANVGRTTPTSQIRYDEFGNAVNVANRVGQAVGQQDLEGYGSDVLKRFAGGDVGNSPIISAAVQHLKDTINPQVENKLAKAGLGRSGELGRELGESSIGYMLPLYMQGVQQQQAAANQLIGQGTEQARRQESAMTRDMGMENLLSNFANQIAASEEGLEETGKAREMSMQNLLTNFANQIGASREQLATDSVNR